MKKLSRFWVFPALVFMISCLLLISCQKEDAPAQKETGCLLIQIESAIQVHEVNSHLKAAPEIKDFTVNIYQADGTLVMSFDSTTVRPDTIELEVGSYYVEVHSANNLPAAFENPYYYGTSDVFDIASNTRQTVLVNCLLANTMVSVVYSGQVVSGFSDYQTTVASALDSLVFLKDETRIGYFQPLPLEIRVVLSYQKPDGTDVLKNLSGSIPFPLANRHYEIQVDASISEGMAVFQITLDSVNIPVEVIEVADLPGITPPGAIAYGELLITEIMANPAALADTEGEWFEVYNNSDHPIQLQNLILGRDDASRHTISEALELLPGEFLVFERSDTATDASRSYVFGSDLLLPNTGAVLSVFNEGSETDPGALIFSVDYGTVNFPEGTGASIALDPAMMNEADAILGTSWCISSSVFNTGDLGTPGSANDPCL
jgi:hypothetical protein